jgi:hypothetical protein
VGIGTSTRWALMAGPADAYRLKAAEMLAKAEEHELFRVEFEALAKAFLRLADQADRNAQMVLPLELDPAALQRQQPSEAPQQQQQQRQPKDDSKKD